MKRIVVLIGGSGSNLEAILQAIQKNHLPLTCAKVISHKPDVLGLKRAQRYQVPTQVIDHLSFAIQDDFEQALIKAIHEVSPDWIVLAGFMRILSSHFIAQFPDKIINIHPSLLPKFRGLNTHKRAIEAQENFHGATVHLVTPELDAGPIIAQARLTMNQDDTPQTLQSRVLSLEHKLYPLVLNWLALGRLTLKDNSILFEEKPIPKQGFMIELNSQEIAS